MSNNDKVSNMIRFTYEDSEGDVSERIVKFRHIEHNENGYFYLTGFCHQAWQVRTFRIDRIIDTITDMETGEIVKAEEWFKRISDDPALNTLIVKKEKSQSSQSLRKKPTFSRSVQTGKGVLFTGFKADERAELEAMVPQVGWHVRKSVSPTVDIVVAGYNAGPKKVQEAIDLGIPVVSEKVFREMCLMTDAA